MQRSGSCCCLIFCVSHFWAIKRLQKIDLLTFRTMTAICFVCNLPILSHQVGLVWQGGNGWDDLVREQLEESTIKQRLGGRRDSSTQICSISPPTETQESSPPATGKFLINFKLNSMSIFNESRNRAEQSSSSCYRNRQQSYVGDKRTRSLV